LLFPEGFDRAAGRFNPRLRITVGLCNWALVSSFASEDRSAVVPAAGTFELPFGRLDGSFDRDAVRAGDRELYQFVPTSELEVRGLGMRYRRSRLGGSDLTKAWDEGFAANAEGQLSAPKEGIEKLKSLMTDMKSSERLSFTYKSGGGVIVDCAGAVKRAVEGDDFAKAFLSNLARCSSAECELEGRAPRRTLPVKRPKGGPGPRVRGPRLPSPHKRWRPT